MSKIGTIWQAIHSILDNVAGPNKLIGCVLDDDFKADVLSKDFPSYPAGIITTPSFSSSVDDSDTNKRVYEFQILFVLKADNNQTAQDVAELAEEIVDLFDNDPTLRDKPDQSVVTFTEPAASAALTLNTTDQTFIIFTVTLKAELYATHTN